MRGTAVATFAPRYNMADDKNKKTDEGKKASEDLRPLLREEAGLRRAVDEKLREMANMGNQMAAMVCTKNVLTRFRPSLFLMTFLLCRRLTWRP